MPTHDSGGPSPQTVEKGIEARERRRYDGVLGPAERDEVAVEAPLELRLGGDPIATTMRTPGDDAALALGFLFAEGIIAAADEVATLAHCGVPGEDGYGNVLEITAGAGVVLDPDRLEASRRGTLVTASCGVCGRASIDDLITRMPAPSRDRFAAAVTASDRRLALAEDVGRHNAVDKVVGRLLRERLVGRGAAAGPEAPRVLVVSGRTSFEIVQKAAVAGFGAVVAVSGPTTLAVDLAIRAGLVLVGFAREGRMNVYANAERLSAGASSGR